MPLHTRTRKISAMSLSRAVQHFHDLHEQLYAYKRPEEPVQIVSIRLELTGLRNRIEGIKATAKFGQDDASAARVGVRQVYFERLGGFVETPVYDGSRVEPGNVIVGPAVIHEPGTTIVVCDGQEAMLDQYETYVIEVLK